MSDEAVEKQETVPALMNAVWRCKHNHKINTTIREGKVFVPYCDTCRKKNNQLLKAAEGLLIDADVAHAAVRKEELVAKGVSRRDALWTHFRTMLNANRVQMADGHLSDRVCFACAKRSHEARADCGCPCHAAWEFCKQTEAEMAVSRGKAA